MAEYKVTGMGCAACSARVEKAVSAVPGVNTCSVSLLTNSMSVEGSAAPDAIISAVEEAGYGASLSEEDETSSDEDAEDHSKSITGKMVRRLVLSICLLLPLFYLSMGHMMWGWPVMRLPFDEHIFLGVIQAVLSFLIIVVNRQFFVNGYRGVINRAPNMDTLVAMGAGVSFIWSIFVLIKMTVMSGTHDEFYFEASGMILTLITVGKLLEEKAKGRTTDAIKQLLDLTPKTAHIIRDGMEITVPVKEVKVDDEFFVYPGESIPADGVVIEGVSAVDESSLTGESIPVDKSSNDTVYTSTINTSGFLKCRALRVGKDTSFSKIIKMVTDASKTKAPIARTADKVAGVFVPVVMTIALITFLIWMFAGENVGIALKRAIAVLVISCPCALGLATPVAIMVGNGKGAKCGILFKTSEALELTGRVNIAVFDKTGTITTGEPVVTDIIPFDGTDKEELLKIAASVESKSEHPLAKAIIKKASEESVGRYDTDGFEALPGNGVKALINEEEISGGSISFIEKILSEAGNPDAHSFAEQKASGLSEEGKTPLLFVRKNMLLGIIAVSDAVRNDSKEAISELKKMGIKTVMLTGDNERTANAVKDMVRVDEVIAGVMPDGKEKVISGLKKEGTVIMVGDGINDAPALVSADVGMAIGAGTDIAIESADVVLTRNTLKDVCSAIRLGRATLRNIHENLFWAFIYNIIGIPVAAGLLIPIFNIGFGPEFSAAAMSLSSFCVVMNALRLNRCRL